MTLYGRICRLTDTALERHPSARDIAVMSAGRSFLDRDATGREINCGHSISLVMSGRASELDGCGGAWCQDQVEYKGKIADSPLFCPLVQLIAVFAARTRRDLTARDEMERIAAARAAASRRRPTIASLFLQGLPARLPRDHCAC